MDQEKFDALVQKLTADASRRGVVRGALTGAVATALGAVGIQSADAKKKKGDGGGPEDERCVPDGRKCGSCGKKKNGKPKCKPCKKCCSRNASEPNARGVRRCVCKPSGATCGNSGQCCSGDCIGGFCVEYGYGGEASSRNKKKAKGGKRNR